MVQLSLACKQLSSNVNTIALSLLESVPRQDESITVFEELNDHRTKLSSKELWVGNKTYKQSLEWLETHVSGINVRYHGKNGSVQKKKLKISSKDGRMMFE